MHIRGATMASKNIAITEDIYHELLKRKHHDESFTRIISRLLKEKDHPSNYFGMWNDLTKAEDTKLVNAKKELRKLWTERTVT